LNEPNDRIDESGAGTRRRWTSPDSPLVAPERADDDRTRLPVERSGSATDAVELDQAPLFSEDEATQLRTRWESVQAGFVDEPRRAVEEADTLVRTVMERLTDGFKQQREQLEQEWGERDNVSTEDLRLALRHYRSFFDRLLKI
jgi:hypothetical protein